MEITDTKLKKEIKSYCDANNIDIAEFVNKIAKKGFSVERYGNIPMIRKTATVENNINSTEPNKNVQILTSEETQDKAVEPNIEDKIDTAKTAEDQTTAKVAKKEGVPAQKRQKTGRKRKIQAL